MQCPTRQYESSNCGTRVSPSAKFCPECAQPVVGAEEHAVRACYAALRIFGLNSARLFTSEV